MPGTSPNSKAWGTSVLNCTRRHLLERYPSPPIISNGPTGCQTGSAAMRAEADNHSSVSKVTRTGDAEAMMSRVRRIPGCESGLSCSRGGANGNGCPSSPQPLKNPEPPPRQSSGSGFPGGDHAPQPGADQPGSTTVTTLPEASSEASLRKEVTLSRGAISPSAPRWVDAEAEPDFSPSMADTAAELPRSP